MSAAVRVSYVHDDERGAVAVQIAPTGPAARAPVNVCAVVDVSGSMNELARVKDKTGVEINDGVRLLDVVKHALRTIAHGLGPNDRMSVVAYSTIARVVVQLVSMDETNKRSALDGIEGLRAGGQTNIADGLREGLDVLREHWSSSGITAIMLLTDGQPNVVPPSGHVTMLQRYAEKNQFMVPVHTFGFGYQAESRLLVEIAEYTKGLYAFIPDATLVGTVFISTLAALFTTLSTTATLLLEYDSSDAATKDPAPFAVRVLEEPGRVVTEMDIGALHQEQARTVVLTCGRAPARVAVRYSAAPCVVAVESSPAPSLSAQWLRSESARQSAAVCIARCVELGRSGKLVEARAAVSAILASADLPAGLRVDIEGQVAEALEDASFARWGQHYLPSLGAAHLYQVSNNCKDPGVQAYGGPLFRALRAETEDIFLALPPPTLTRHTAPPNMEVYAGYSGSCFSGECPVEMRDGTSRLVKDIKKGDEVKGGATVVCVVRTDTEKTVDMTRVGDLIVTAWHPMRGDDGQWVFPCEVEGAKTASCDAVYNFVLDRLHEVTVAGKKLVTLGHGLTGAVVAHPYFGTRAVIEDLQNAIGWEMGVVRLVGSVRGADGLVCGLISPKNGPRMGRNKVTNGEGQEVPSVFGRSRTRCARETDGPTIEVAVAPKIGARNPHAKFLYEDTHF
jgi:Mg-chelatase subunit ChlD